MLQLNNTALLLMKTGVGLIVAAGLSLLVMQAVVEDKQDTPTPQEQTVQQPRTFSTQGQVNPPPTLQTEALPPLSDNATEETDFWQDSDGNGTESSPQQEAAASADQPTSNEVAVAVQGTSSAATRVKKTTNKNKQKAKKPKTRQKQPHTNAAPVTMIPIVTAVPEPQSAPAADVPLLAETVNSEPQVTSEPETKPEPVLETTHEEIPKENLDEESDVGSYQNTAISEGDIILDVLLRNDLVYQGLFCQGKDNKLFLPSREIFGIVGFPINVTAEGADGWFIKEDNRFTFSAETGEATSNGKFIQLPKDGFFYFEDDLYIELGQFAKMFPLKFTADISNLYLIITPRQKLPMELMKMRRNKRRIEDAKTGLIYPLQDLDYAALAPPRLDTKLSLGHYGGNNKEATKATLGGLYRGDLMFMSTALYGAISSTNVKDDSEFDFKDFSITAERLFPDNSYISKVTLGDIIPATTPIGPSGTLERGIRVANTSALSKTSQDSKTFSGKGIPGWDVELYRNNQLVGFETIKPDGTYTFENISLSYGVNRFKLILYGTEGQEEVREEIVTVGTSLIAGEVQYDASVSQQGVGVFDDDISKVQSVSKDLKGTHRVKSKINVGLGNGMALRSGITLDTFDNTERSITSLGFSAGFDRFLGQVDLGYSSYGSTVLQTSLRGQLDGGQDISLYGFVQQSDNYKESSTKNNINFGYTDQLKLSESVRATYSGKISRTTQSSTSGDLSYYDLTGSFGLFSDFGYLSTNLGTRLYENSKNTSVYGSSTFYKGFSKGSIRANADYSINNENNSFFKSLSATGNLRINQKVSTSLKMSQYFTGSNSFTVSNTWSYLFENLNPYIEGKWRDDNAYSIFAGISVSFDLEPGTLTPYISNGSSSAGGASCLVYNDKNYNNKFDAGDEPMEDVTLTAPQANAQTITDKNGRGLFYQLPDYRSTDIYVEESEMNDIRFSATSGAAITPREGKIYNLEFPLHLCGEIEGYTYRIVDDQVKGRPSIPVQLVNATNDVVKETWTEQDGYFAIDKVLPGTYTLRVSPSYLESKSRPEFRFAGTTVNAVVINDSGNSVTDAFLFFGKKENVAILEEKFKTKLKLGDDAQQFFDYADMDVPQEQPLNDAATLVNQILTEMDITKVSDMDAEVTQDAATAAQPSVASEENMNAKAEPVLVEGEMNSPDTPVAGQAIAENSDANKPEIDKNLILIVDVFTSPKSAARAIAHYSKIYADKLMDFRLQSMQKGNGYYVYIKGISKKEDLLNMANLFMCQPTMIEAKDLL